MRHVGTNQEDMLTRDIAILRSLAQLHCATATQLHALCFPFQALATARTSLYYLAQANLVARSNWRIRGLCQEQGQVWTLTTKGHDLLQRYRSPVPPLARIDLGRPSTALEHEEWRVRILVRTLVVRLLLEARRLPLLHSLEIQLPGDASWPSAWPNGQHRNPDGIASILWSPARQKTPNWLPWIDSELLLTGVVRYPVFVERTQAQPHLPKSAYQLDASTEKNTVPILIFQNEEHCAAACQQLTSLARETTVRMSTPALLEDGLMHNAWRDAHGFPCQLRALAQESML